jgi:polysaccharide biosynthesis protein PslH
VVSTPSGCAGLGLLHRKNVWVAANAGDFAAGISSLIEDTILRAEVASNARRWVEERFQWGKIGKEQRGICNV